MVNKMLMSILKLVADQTQYFVDITKDEDEIHLRGKG